MSLFFGKKEQAVIELFHEHLDAVENTIRKLLELIQSMKNASSDKIKELAERVREAETAADKVRRKAEMEMYSGAFLPNFRGDLLGTIESLDRIANKAEAVADEIDLQNLKIPAELFEDFENLVKKSFETYMALKDAAKEMFEDFESANEKIIDTEKFEHETDQIERKTIRKIFSMENLPLAEKIQLKKLVHRIADISDTSEDVSDRIQIILYKRKV
ncbi:TIGR00153 family protein [Thermosipho ferrireducens]|uniref:TIGR00153 family protein n=1 Tax=Thermosipho ferrireducens TaxID=2571116 RepID=A0ABX7S7J3_9BACT|nr:TIGR00153 family protein [Thermosipho ferrireducens]QTA37775.1 TIGR00153 family protein [Thermosipho ferrireducens]